MQPTKPKALVWVHGVTGFQGVVGVTGFQDVVEVTGFQDVWLK